MKKDIPDHRVEGLALAIVPRKEGEENEELWDVYLLNLKEDSISSVLISSKGYGELKGKKMETTVLRHFFNEVAARDYIKVEPIQVKLFGLTNEYWVSFVHEDYMYDKKYVFVKGSISTVNFTTIPMLGRKGVMIR